MRRASTCNQKLSIIPCTHAFLILFLYSPRGWQTKENTSNQESSAYIKTATFFESNKFDKMLKINLLWRSSERRFQRIDSIGTWRAAIVSCKEDCDEKWSNYSRKREEARNGRRPTMEWNGEGLPTRFPSNATGAASRWRRRAFVQPRSSLILFHSIL